MPYLPREQQGGVGSLHHPSLDGWRGGEVGHALYRKEVRESVAGSLTTAGLALLSV